MPTPTDRSELLSEVLSEGPADETAPASLAVLLQAVEQRRSRRRQRPVWIATLAVLAGLGWWGAQPQPRPAKPAAGPQLVAQLPPSATPSPEWWVTTQMTVPTLQTSDAGLAYLVTPPDAPVPPNLSDDDLLNLGGSTPVALVRRANGHRELVTLARR